MVPLCSNVTDTVPAGSYICRQLAQHRMDNLFCHGLSAGEAWQISCAPAQQGTAEPEDVLGASKSHVVGTVPKALIALVVPLCQKSVLHSAKVGCLVHRLAALHTG